MREGLEWFFAGLAVFVLALVLFLGVTNSKYFQMPDGAPKKLKGDQMTKNMKKN